MDQTSAMQMSNMVSDTITLEGFGNHGTTPGSVGVSNIMRIDISPCLGYSPDTAASRRTGVNSAGLKTYTLLSSDNAKTTQYAPQDITMCILSVGELIAGIATAKRALGCAYYYNKRNFAYPLSLLKTMRFNAQDLIENLADYRIRLNILITRCNQISIPANIAWFAKQEEYYKYIFKDSESEMAQTFYWMRDTFWELDETTDPNGSMLKVVNPWASGDINFSSFLRSLESMLDAVLTSSTFNYIYADVLKAADKKGVPLYTFELVPTDYLVVPGYNETASLQVQNAVVLGSPESTAVGATHTAGNEVHSSATNNIVVYSPTWKHDVPFANKSAIIDFPTENPDLRTRVESTVLTAVGHYEADYDSTNGWVFESMGLGDAYVTKMTVYNSTASSANALSWSRLLLTSAATTIFRIAGAFSQFRCTPRIIMWDAAGAAAAMTGSMVGELNFFTTVDYQYMHNVNNVKLMSLLTVR